MALLVKSRMRVTYNLLRLFLTTIKEVRIIGSYTLVILYQNIVICLRMLKYTGKLNITRIEFLPLFQLPVPDFTY